MKCPKCETESLKSNSIRGIEVDQCSQCKGVWFDEDELSKLIEEQASSGRVLKGSDSGMDRKGGNCPQDQTPLLRVYSKRNRSVVIDHCSTCKGVWLDGGEFQRLID